MGINKMISLRGAFWKFLIMLLVGLILSVAIPFSILLLNVSFGIITYADYSERMVQKIAPIIATAPDFSEINFPNGCDFLRLDKSYQIIETTLSDNEVQYAINYAKTGIMEGQLNKQYMLVTRDNEYVVLKYRIGSQFTNNWLNQHLPSPEILLYALIGINCVFVSVILTTRFSKYLCIQLSALFEATEKISSQDLDFMVGQSKVKEFEELLCSFDEMKTNLKNSLENQWKIEQSQKEHIAALAHDLKTPLTIIQGNADLISETKLDEEQKLYVDYIIESSEQMQIYIKTLIDISRTAMGYCLNIENVNVSEYIMHIVKQIDSLCHANKIYLVQNNLIIEQQNIQIDKLQIERAIMNVVNNAIEHSEEGKRLYITFLEEKNCLVFSVTDEGKGFSKEALQHAHECFFMDDNSRTSRMHFGMGLYIAASIIKQHKGELILENSLQTKGAKVIIKLPYD